MVSETCYGALEIVGSTTTTGTLAVDEWAVTFDTAMRLGAQPASLYQM